MDFFDRLRKLMEQNGDTNNSVLAKKSGIPYTTIDGLFKRGWEKAQIITIQRICDYYGVSLDYMVYGADKLSERGDFMLHEKLSARRRSIGMGIDQLVELSGIPKGTVTKVLTGVTKNPALETVKAIAYAMGMTLDDLAECDVVRTETLSEQALQFAAKYDTLDTPGKELIAAVMDTQFKRIDTYGHCKVLKRIPL